MTSSGTVMLGSYDYGIVILSVVISILAASAALDLAGRVATTRGKARFAWLMGGATASGIGTWSMHYTGMRAFSLPVPVKYDWPTVLLSLLPAVFGSAVALFVVSRTKMGLLRLLAGGVLVGGGISAMHFTGMASMRLAGMCYYSPLLVTLSIALSILFSVVPLELTFVRPAANASRRLAKAASVILLGAANPVMHYTAMAGTRFTRSTMAPDMAHAVSISTIGLRIFAIIPLMILTVALATSLADRLHKERALLDRLFEQAPQAVVLTDPDNRVLRVNGEFTRVFGYTAQETIGRRLDDLIVPGEAREEFQKHMELVVTHGQRVDTEGIRQRKDGSRLYASITRVPVALPGGQSAVYAILRDITERQQATQVLRQSEERHRSVVETASDAVISINKNGQIILANHATTQVFGYTPSELMGMPLTILMPEFLRDSHRAGFERYLMTGERTMDWQSMEFIGLRKTGDQFPIEISFGEFVNNGQHTFTGFIRDITERKRAEQELRRSEERLRHVIDTVPALIQTALPDGNFDYFNQRWLDYVGLSLDDLSGWKWTAVFHPEDVGTTVEKWRAALATGEPFTQEARLRRADGEYRWMFLRKVPLRDDRGNIVKWYGSSVDIEDRKRAEEGLRAAIYERARLSAVRAEIGMALARKDSLREILCACAEVIVQNLDAAFARIWTLSSNGQELELQASAGMYTRLNGRYGRISFGEIKVGHIAQERRAHLTNDVQNDPRIKDKDWARAENITSFAGYPLVVEDRTVGVMGMFSQKPITESTLDTLSLLADGIAHGIERKWAEEDLRKQKEILQKIFDNIPVMIRFVGPDGKTKLVNREWERTIGWTLEEILGEDLDVFAELYPDPEDRQKVMKFVFSSKPEFADLRTRVRDGRVIDTSWASVRLSDGTSIAIGRDITERKRAEEALRKSEERWRSVFENSAIGVALTDLNGHFLATNPVYQKIVGFSGEELRELSFLEITQEEYREANWTLIAELLEGKRQQFQIEKQYRRKDGSLIWVRNSVSLVPGSESVPRFIMALSDDITDRKRAEEALRRSEVYLAEGQRLAHTGSWAYNPSGFFDHWSQELFRIYGFDPAKGAPTLAEYLSAVHPQDREFMAGTIEKMVAQGIGCDVKKRILRPDGELRYVRCVGVPIFDNGTLKSLVGTAIDVTEQEQLTQALRRSFEEVRRSEERWRAVFENSAVGIALTDCVSTRFQAANLAFQKMVGYPVEELRTLSFLDITYEDDREANRQLLAELLEGRRQSYAMEKRYRRKNGSLLWVNLHASLVAGTESITRFSLAIVEDITERKRAEEALRDSEARFRTIFENAGVGMAVVDLEGHPVKTNPALRQMLDYSEEELSRMVFTEFTHPDDREADLRLYGELAAGKRDRYEIEKRYLKRGGGVAWGQLVVSLVKDPQRRPVYCVGMVEDITERKHAEAALRDSEERYRTLFERNMAGVYRTTLDGRILECNQAMANILGFSSPQEAKKFRGQDNYFSDEERAQFIETLEAEGRLTNVEVRRRRKDGSPVWLLANLSLITQAPGGQRILDGTFVDITERKRAEEELQRSRDKLRALAARLQKVREEERTRVAREIHDELGQALTAIKIDLSAVISRLPAERKTQSGSLLQLVDATIQSVRRIATELRPIILDELGLVAAVEWACEEFQARTGIKCRWDLPDDDVVIDSERATALFRIFQETLTNVARHANATAVSVRLAKENGNLFLEVHDNGKGVNEEQLSAGGSLGILGMRERALLLGGELTISSTAGKGTTVIARIPETQTTLLKEGK